MPRRMTPVRGFWLGVVLTLVGPAVASLLIGAMFAIGGQTLASSDFVRFVNNLFGGVVLPLGMTFVVLSVVARALESTGRPMISAAGFREGIEDTPSVPPRVSSRIAFVTGLVLVVIGMASELYLHDWIQEIQADATFLRDFVLYLGPPLNALMLPLGVLLIPCAWILRIIEERELSDVP